jgi:hypothetical protein
VPFWASGFLEYSGELLEWLIYGQLSVQPRSVNRLNSFFHGMILSKVYYEARFSISLFLGGVVICFATVASNEE